MKKFYLRSVIVSILILVFAGVALLMNSGGRAEPSSAPLPPKVTVSQPIAQKVVEWDEYTGRLEAVESVEVRARVSGYLESVHFEDGAMVKKGDLLFVIDPRPYQAELERAQAEYNRLEAKLELAINDFERANRLLKTKAISEEEFDTRSKAQREAQAAIDAAKAAVTTAKLNLEYTRVTSPMDGLIGRKLVTEGNLVNGNVGQATLLATIVSLDPIYCYVDIDEIQLLKYQQLTKEGKWVNKQNVNPVRENGRFVNGEGIIKPPSVNFILNHRQESAAFSNGVKVPSELALANEKGFPHKGMIDFMNNRLDPNTGTLKARGVFSNPGGTMTPGFFARVRVPGSEEYEGLLIPDEALGTDQSQKFVYVSNSQNIVEYRAVKTGPRVHGLRVITEGLHPSDWIVVNGVQRVRPNAQIDPQKETISFSKKSKTNRVGTRITALARK